MTAPLLWVAADGRIGLVNPETVPDEIRVTRAFLEDLLDRHNQLLEASND